MHLKKGEQKFARSKDNFIKPVFARACEEPLQDGGRSGKPFP